MKATLTMERQTKGAVLYTKKNGGSGSSAITSIYLRKDGFPDGSYPGSIVITIEDEAAQNG